MQFGGVQQVYGFAPQQHPQYAPKGKVAAGHKKGHQHAPKGLPAPTVTNANANPYAVMPYTGAAGYPPQYAQQQQQHAPTVMGGGYPTSLIAAPGMGGAGSGLNELNQVHNGLWIGSCRSLQVGVLQQCGIRHVVNTAKELKKGGVDWAALKKANIVVMHVPWEDNFTQQIFPNKALNDAINFIDQVFSQGGQVLVNCAMGRSRSTSLAIAYLIIRRGFTYDQALAQVQSKRPICQPNSFFEDQLRNVERSVRMKNQPQQGKHAQQQHAHQQHAQQQARPASNQFGMPMKQQQQPQSPFYPQQQQHAGTVYAPQYGAGQAFGYPATARGVPQQQAWGWAGTGVGAMW